jgi:transposase, IS30 family
MQKNHRHLRLEDRGVIYRMNQAGKAQSEIAETIGFSQGTVSKELRRNRGQKGYRHKQAHGLSEGRKRSKVARRAVLEGDLLVEVERRLRLRYSPEQISGSLRKEGLDRVSHETIYRYVREDKKAGGDLYTYLRINGKRRYRRRAKAGRYNKIPARVGIEDRPASVENRTRYGDWEIDLIEGSKGSGFILSMYERKTRTCRLRRLNTKGAVETSKAIIEALAPMRVRTLTYDNGPEFSRHREVSEALEAKGYFCSAYHSWEKGGVENLNGLVRQYFPKGSSFEDITLEKLQAVETALNTRPRKTLGFTSPSEHEQKIAA